MNDDFVNTKVSFAKIESSMANIERLMSHKREQMKQRQSTADQRIAELTKKVKKLKEASAFAADGMEKIVNRLDKILVENGSGNDNDKL